MVSLVLALALLLTTDPSYGMEFKGNKCPKLLAAVDAYKRQTEGFSNVKDVESFFHMFRAKNLGDFEYDLSSNAVVATSNSTKGTKKKVTGRISEIIEQARNKHDSNGKHIRFDGIQLVGTQKIKSFLEIMKAIDASFSEYKSAQVKGFNINMAMHTLFTMGFNGSIMSIMGLIQEGKIPWMNAMFLAVLRTAPEEYIRFVRSFDYGKDNTLRLEDELSRMKSEEQWNYRSYDLQMSARSLAELNKDPYDLSVINDVLSEHRYINGVPKRTLKYTWDTFGKLKALEAIPKSWFRVDEILSFDKSIQEPVLTILIRQTEEIKKYPRNGRKIDNKKKVTDTLSAPIPVSGGN